MPAHDAQEQSPVARPARRTRALPYVVGVLLLALAGVGIWYWTSRVGDTVAGPGPGKGRQAATGVGAAAGGGRRGADPRTVMPVTVQPARTMDFVVYQNALGNVAETGTSNVFMAKDGVVRTPAPNGTFLNGITRQRVIQLLRDDGVEVKEETLRYEDFQNADEIFISGNYSKVMPVLRIDDRDLQPGPLYRKARELYWDFSRTRPA